MTDALVKGIFVGLFMAISVGPTLFAVIRYSITGGYKAGWAFILGVSASDIMYVTIANIAAAWLQYLVPYEKPIAIGGAILLMGMGIAGFFKKEKPVPAIAGIPVISGGHYLKIWTSGFLVNTLNPGVLITWLGAVTLTAGQTGFYRLILFGTGLAVTLAIDCLKVFLAGKIKGFLTPHRIMIVNRISAFCLFGIGVSLMVTTMLASHGTKAKKESRIDQILSK